MKKKIFIEDINTDKINNFLSKLRNNKYLSKILELIKNKITDIIPHIMEIKREYIIYKNFRRKKRNKWKVYY